MMLVNDSVCLQRDEAVKVFEHSVSLGVKPNAKSYALLVDAHLIKRDIKAALSTINEMVMACQYFLIFFQLRYTRENWLGMK